MGHRGPPELDKISDPQRRAPNPRKQLPAELLTFQWVSAFEFDERKFSQNLRSFRKGAVSRPSGMFAEHFRSLLEVSRVLQSLYRGMFRVTTFENWWSDHGTTVGHGSGKSLTNTHCAHEVVSVVHALKALCKTDHESTILSTDGVKRSTNKRCLSSDSFTGSQARICWRTMTTSFHFSG